MYSKNAGKCGPLRHSLRPDPPLFHNSFLAITMIWQPQNMTTHPLLMWSSLAFKTTEMLLASAQVIGHRTARMANAGAIPNTRDQKEFTLMGKEKVEAVAESAWAMTTRMIGINQQLAAMTFRQMLDTSNGFLALATSATLTQSNRRRTQLLRDALAHSTGSAAHLAGSMAGLAQQGLKPIHSRATRNAKRLRKVKL
jgi:hypothetical protein